VALVRNRELRSANNVRPPELLPESTAGFNRRKATTSSRDIDEALFIITTSPLTWPTRLRPPLPSPYRAATRGTPSSTLAHRVARVREGLRHSQAVRRHHRKIAPDRNCLARERTPGNEVMKDRSVVSNLTLRITREPSRLTRNRPSVTHMSGANGHPFASAMSRSRRTGIGCS
jgi:hypothetical protein